MNSPNGDERAPYDDQARERWPVPDEVKGASAVDAFMWYAVDGLVKIFGHEGGPWTEAQSDFGLHAVRLGDLRLTLEWDVSDEEEGRA